MGNLAAGAVNQIHIAAIKRKLFRRKCKRFFASLLLSVSTLSAGCGILGSKKEKSKSLSLTQKSNCLQNLDQTIGQFFKGEISTDEWSGTWKCVVDDINHYQNYVKKSDNNGYNKADVKILMERFLLGGKSFPDRGIDALFKLKRTFLGGDDTAISLDDLSRVKSLIHDTAENFSALIPLLQENKKHSTAAGLSELDFKAKNIIQNFLASLHLEDRPSLAQADLVDLFTALGESSFGNHDAADSARWAEFTLRLRILLVGGNEAEWTPTDFTQLLTFGFGFLIESTLLFMAEPSDDAAIEQRLQVVRDRLNLIFKQNGDKILNTQLFTVTDQLPNALCSHKPEDFRQAIRQLFTPRLRPNGQTTSTVEHLFHWDNPDQIEPATFDYLMSEVDAGLLVLKRARATYGDATKMYTQTQLLNRFENDFEIFDVISTHQGMYPQTARVIQFENWEQWSFNNLAHFLWFDRIARNLLEIYGTAEKNGQKAGNSDDLFQIVEDFKALLYSISFLHPAKLNPHLQRFREMNLFMPSSDGDQVVTISEASEYFAYIFSISSLTVNLEKNFIKGVCSVVGTDPVLELPQYEIECFRSSFSNAFPSLFGMMKGLVQDFIGFSTDARHSFMATLESIAKLTGYNQDPVTAFDMNGYVGLPYFAETIYRKIDRENGAPDGTISRNETLTYAYPLFKSEISGLTHIDNDLVNQALLIYLIREGHSPFKCNTKPTFAEIQALIQWLAQLGPLSPFQSGRAKIYEIFAALSNSAAGCAP